MTLCFGHAQEDAEYLLGFSRSSLKMLDCFFAWFCGSQRRRCEHFSRGLQILVLRPLSLSLPLRSQIRGPRSAPGGGASRPPEFRALAPLSQGRQATRWGAGGTPPSSRCLLASQVPSRGERKGEAGHSSVWQPGDVRRQHWCLLLRNTLASEKSGCLLAASEKSK